MRNLLLTSLLICGGCGLKQVLPGTAVLTSTEQDAFEQQLPADVQYTGEARAGTLFPPLQFFGLQYAVDVVLVSEHPDWEMHEYARLDTPDGSIWVAKDAAKGGAQTIVSDAPNLKQWLPEIPIPRIQSPITVVDESKDERIDLQLSYTNAAGEPVKVWTQGSMPSRPPAKRNGNTMGHSRSIVAAVLDLERFGSNVRAGIQIGDEKARLKRLLGLMPFKFLLRQTQGGVAITSFRVAPAAGGFTLTRPASPDEAWPTHAEEAWQQDGETIHYDNGVCRFKTHFNNGEAHHSQVMQAGVEHPIFQMWFSPALPDLRRPFTGTAESQFRMDIGDQSAHGTGRIHVKWIDADTVQLLLTPTEPDWLTDRPMKTLIRYDPDGSIRVHTVRID